jgi:hypothetical protein
MTIGGTEGRMESVEELPPCEGERTTAPPWPGSEGFGSGRPRENSSIDDLGPLTEKRKVLKPTVGLRLSPARRTNGARHVNLQV